MIHAIVGVHVDQSKITKWELRILTHLIKYPGNWLVSELYMFIPPPLKSPFFKRKDCWGVCECSMCRSCGPYVAKSFIKLLVKEGFLQKRKCIGQYLNRSDDRYIRWIFVSEVVEQIPELKELMVQKAVGAI